MLAFSKTKQNITIKEFSENNTITKNPFLVFDDKDRLVGLISKREINNSHKKTRDLTNVSDVMYKKFHTTLPDEYLFTVIQKMNSHPFDMIPVIDPNDNGKVIGIITNEAIMNLLTETEKS